MKKNLSVILICLLLASLFLAGCGGSGDAEKSADQGGSSTASGAPTPENPVTFKLATLFDTDHPVVIRAEAFAKEVSEKTNGAVNIKIYPNSTLSEPVASFEEVSRGTVDMTLNAAPSTYDIFFEVPNWPYLASSYEEAGEIYSPDGWLFSKFTELCADKNIKFLAFDFVGYNGMGFVTTPTEYNVPGTAKGILLRCPPLETTDTWANDMGFRTVSIAYSDLYTALQTGACDGWTGGQPTVNYLSFRDVIKSYCQYGNGFEMNSFCINMDDWNSLSEEQQQIMTEAAKTLYERSLTEVEQDTDKYIKLLADEGIEILPLTDEEVKAFADYTRKNTYPKFKDSIGEESYNELMKGLGFTE